MYATERVVNHEYRYDWWQAHVQKTNMRRVVRSGDASMLPSLSPRSMGGMTSSFLGSPREATSPRSMMASPRRTAKFVTPLNQGNYPPVGGAGMNEPFFPGRSPRRAGQGKNTGPAMPDKVKPVQPELVVAAPVEEEPMTEEDLWKEKTRLKEIEILRSQTEEVIYSRFKNMKRAFQHIDIDGSGKVDANEIGRAIKLWNIPMTEDKLAGLIQKCDKDGDGGITYDEFVDVLARETVNPEAIGKRGMSSKEAFGVDNWAMLDQAMGKGKKVNAEKYVSLEDKFKMSAFYEEGRDD